MKQDGIGRETNHKRLLISQNKLRVAMGRGIMERVAGLWTLGRTCDMVSVVKCVSLTIHRPVPLGQIIHYMLIKIIKKKIDETGHIQAGVLEAQGSSRNW